MIRWSIVSLKYKAKSLVIHDLWSSRNTWNDVHLCNYRIKCIIYRKCLTEKAYFAGCAWMFYSYISGLWSIYSCVLSLACRISTQMLLKEYFYGLVQDCYKSIANALQLLQSCTKPLICTSSYHHYRGGISDCCLQISNNGIPVWFQQT